MGPDLETAVPAGARQTFLDLVLNHSQIDKPDVASDLLLALHGIGRLQSQSEETIASHATWPVSLTDEQDSLENQILQLNHGESSLRLTIALMRVSGWNGCSFPFNFGMACLDVFACVLVDWNSKVLL